jgi:predicted  nucleic acid-binding Zn-ribbon protein
MSEGTEKDLHTMKTEVEILKRDVSSIQNLLSKLDTAIDKIANVSNDISKMLAVHQQALESIRDDVDERKRLAEKETELLHKRISDMKDEGATERRANHKAIIDMLTDMRTEIRIEINEVRDGQKDLAKRVVSLERWKWWIMGGSSAVGFILATFFQAGNFIAKFFGGQ